MDLHVMGARLRRTPVFTKREKLLHDFGNQLQDVVFAAREQNEPLTRFYVDEVTKLYAEAIDGNQNKAAKQGKAA